MAVYGLLWPTTHHGCLAKSLPKDWASYIYNIIYIYIYLKKQSNKLDHCHLAIFCVHYTLYIKASSYRLLWSLLMCLGSCGASSLAWKRHQQEPILRAPLWRVGRQPGADMFLVLNMSCNIVVKPTRATSAKKIIFVRLLFGVKNASNHSLIKIKLVCDSISRTNIIRKIAPADCDRTQLKLSLPIEGKASS